MNARWHVHHEPRLIDLAPELASVRTVALDGLARAPKTLPAWLFYDDEGSRLFEAICAQPEYYPTRTELGILRDEGRSIAATLGEGCQIIELGSGSHRKASALLRLLRRPEGYVAIDVSGDALREAITTLAREFPCVPMTGIVAAASGSARRIGFFPGSTIGNMTPDEARVFLAAWAPRLAGGGMLIGVDLVKDDAVLNAAYNDAAGVTAAFNLNILARLNRELGADFDLRRFRHHAFFNRDASRIEMHLESIGPQRVRIGAREFLFRSGETIHTENSYKYTVESFHALALAAGFTPVRTWCDEQTRFSVHYLSA
jgi:L-histidine N-alpha-methyltransferase